MTAEKISSASANMPAELTTHEPIQHNAPSNIIGDHSDAYPYISEYFNRWEVTHQEILEFYDRDGVDRDVAVMDQYYREQQNMSADEPWRNLGIFQGIDVISDYKKAIDYLKKAEGCYRRVVLCYLECCYTYGKVVKSDYKIAGECFYKPQLWGRAVASYILGLMHYYGKGVDKNYAKANNYFHNAALGKFAAANYSLGLMYYYGKGVDKDITSATEYFRMAEEEGFTEASYALECCNNEGYAHN